MIRLSSIRDSFEGVIPSIIATTNQAGIPNISYLSHMHYIDERHIAISNQFFSKTATNVRHSGKASAMVVSGRTGVQHMLDLRFESSETTGPLFERVAAHIRSMSHGEGMEEVMRLRAVDIFYVEDCRLVVPVAPLAVLEPQEEDNADRLALAAALVKDIAAQSDGEMMLDVTLEGLKTLFGFENAMVLVPDDDGAKLSTIASIGYGNHGFGAQIGFGEGAAGMAAMALQPVRTSDMSRGLRYVSAVKATSETAERTIIPLPMLSEPRSQVAVPMLNRGRLMGVLFAESERNFAFDHRDEDVLVIVGTQLAAGLDLVERERQDVDIADVETAADGHGVASERFSFRFHPHDGAVFVGEDYVIRGVPGRLLHHFVESYVNDGRREFSNREIRRNRSLALPDFKDNLETRLILLRRRLEEKAGPIRLERPERGRIKLVLMGTPEMEIRQD